eukprot:7105084-Alexandrium_andersonii.AAC.1
MECGPLLNFCQCVVWRYTWFHRWAIHTSGSACGALSRPLLHLWRASGRRHKLGPNSRRSGEHLAGHLGPRGLQGPNSRPLLEARS